MRNRHTTDANATCKPYDRFSRSLKYIPEISLGSCFKRLLADPTILIRGQFTDNSGDRKSVV